MNNETDKYLEALKATQGDVKPLELEMPSTARTGLKWRYFPFSLQSYIVSGRLPMHLLSKLQSVKNAPDRDMSEDEAFELGKVSLEITASIMLNHLDFPKISFEPKEGHILPEQIDPDDFQYFMQFCLRSGGQVAEKKTYTNSSKTSKKRLA